MIVISVQTFHFAGPGIRVFFFQPDTDRASVLKTPKTRKNRTLSKYPVSGPEKSDSGPNPSSTSILYI